MSRLPMTGVEPGCYVDRSHGPFKFGMVCDLATDSGWEPPAHYFGVREGHDDDVVAACENRWLHVPDPTVLLTYVDEAEEWLNEHTDGPGSWSWFEGDFGYWIDEDDVDD